MQNDEARAAVLAYSTKVRCCAAQTTVHRQLDIAQLGRTPPRPERDLSLGEGSMDQLSSSEGLAPRRWPIHRARLAASASSLLQASEDRTPFQTGETATYCTLYPDVA